MIQLHQWQALSDRAALSLIGSFIKYNRLSQNKTQADLAEEAGLHRSTLVQMEKGNGGTMHSFIRVLRMLRKMDMLYMFDQHSQPSPIQLADFASRMPQRASQPRTRKSK